MASFAKGPHILDIGYAEAPNGYLCEKGHVVGYDIVNNDEALGYHETLQGDIAGIATLLKERKFNTILLGELIEHVEAPYAFLRNLQALLHDDSRLIISTPNPLSFPVLWFEFFRSKRFFYTPDHLYYFLPRWMERMLDVAGYSLEKTQSVGLYRFPIPVPKILSYILIYVAAKKTAPHAR